MVGVNEFDDSDNVKPSIFELDPKVKELQVERLTKIKRERNSEEVRKKISELKARAGDSGNMMPAIVDAVESYATLGEISDALREIWGTYEAG